MRLAKAEQRAEGLGERGGPEHVAAPGARTSVVLGVAAARSAP
jgi:hypothetical protein